jgi:CBS domain-containing protein
MIRPIKYAMSSRVITALATEDLQSAYDKMRDHYFRHLPVVNEGGEIVGMLSERDLERAMVTEPSYLSPRDRTVEFDADFKVKDFMTSNVQVIHEAANLKKAARLMRDRHISSLLVVDDASEMVGIITRDDLLTVLIELLNREPSLIDEFKVLAYKSPIGAIARFLGQAGI